MSTKKQTPAADVADQDAAKNDQTDAAVDQSAAVEDRSAPVVDQAAETVKLRAVYALDVRHPDKTHANGAPLIFSQHTAIEMPAHTVDPESADRDQWIIDIMAQGYLVLADA